MNDCLISVDCVDFGIPHAGRKFHTHKWKFHSALRYEIGVCILTGWLVWINGPYEAGKWNDIMIFRNSLLSHLEDGERVEADDGLIGVAPQYSKVPKSMGHRVECEEMQQRVRSRHETINKRFKQWQIMKQIYRGKMEDHADYFRVVSLTTQLSIIHGEPLFQIDYQDPYDDDYYFDESDTESDGDEEENNRQW